MSKEESKSPPLGAVAFPESVDRQESVVARLQTSLLSMTEPGTEINTESCGNLSKISQALAVQIDKLATIRGRFH